jgi:hypothetical protein
MLRALKNVQICKFIEYVKNQFQNQFLSWLHVLEILYSKNILKDTTVLQIAYSNAMGVICNYNSNPHVDNDLLLCIKS